MYVRVTYICEFHETRAVKFVTLIANTFSHPTWNQMLTPKIIVLFNV